MKRLQIQAILRMEMQRWEKLKFRAKHRHKLAQLKVDALRGAIKRLDDE